MAPPAGAGLLSVTVHVVTASEFNFVGLQASDLTVGEAVRLITAVCETPPIVAVRVALWFVAIFAAVAVNLVEMAPAGIVADAAGMRSSRLLLDKDTAVPPVGAGLPRVIAQVVVPPLLKLVGVQARELGSAGASKLTLAVCDVPFKVAVNVAVWLLAIVPAVAVDVAEVDPAATVTEAGAGRSLLLLDSVIVAPPEGAAALRPTVHVVEAPELMLLGLHTSEDSATGGVRLITAAAATPLGRAAAA
jgi:hypothetical protein